MIWSMLANIGAYVGVSLLGAPERGRARPGDAVRRRLQRTAEASGAAFLARQRLGARSAARCSARFLGPERAPRGLRRLRAAARPGSIDELQADAELVHFAETLLAGAIGAPRRASWWPRW